MTCVCVDSSIYPWILTEVNAVFFSLLSKCICHIVCILIIFFLLSYSLSYFWGLLLVFSEVGVQGERGDMGWEELFLARVMSAYHLATPPSVPRCLSISSRLVMLWRLVYAPPSLIFVGFNPFYLSYRVRVRHEDAFTLEELWLWTQTE